MVHNSHIPNMNIMETHGAKRKRSIDDSSTTHGNSSPSSSNVTHINYLLKAREDRLKLIEGDPVSFSDVLGLLDEYEGVLQRHESLAANLGAKLVAPLLLKSFEKVFDGPLKILQAPFSVDYAPITWLDVVEFARNNPSAFTMTESSAGRAYQFSIKHCRVQISEDDYRLVLSGAPERLMPTQPIGEDEVAEMATIDILEQRLTGLIRKADLVAARARQLNYHLKGRKTTIQSRRAAVQPAEQLTATVQGGDTGQSSTPFQAVNARSATNTESQALHQDLLRQFISDDRKGTPIRAKPGRQVADAQNPASPGVGTSHPPPSVDELSGGQYRPLMAAKNEKLNRGERIWPPCDRCRRLRMDCTKYLTACAGCTKKHAKCTWNDITEEEVAYIVRNQASTGEDDAARSDVEMNSVMDAGHRPANIEGVDIEGNSEGDMFGHQSNGRRAEASDEHRILSQMASTAEAAVAMQ